jgi:hypothetical protein
MDIIINVKDVNIDNINDFFIIETYNKEIIDNKIETLIDFDFLNIQKEKIKELIDFDIQFKERNIYFNTTKENLSKFISALYNDSIFNKTVNLNLKYIFKSTKCHITEKNVDITTLFKQGIDNDNYLYNKYNINNYISCVKNKYYYIRINDTFNDIFYLHKLINDIIIDINDYYFTLDSIKLLKQFVDIIDIIECSKKFRFIKNGRKIKLINLSLIGKNIANFINMKAIKDLKMFKLSYLNNSDLLLNEYNTLYDKNMIQKKRFIIGLKDGKEYEEYDYFNIIHKIDNDAYKKYIKKTYNSEILFIKQFIKN